MLHRCCISLRDSLALSSISANGSLPTCVIDPITRDKGPTEHGANTSRHYISLELPILQRWSQGPTRSPN